jgi:hypothetical protein
VACFVYVTTRFEGLHHWPDAPEGVKFLRHPHRHVFHVKVYVEVRHGDREVEFITFKRTLEDFIQFNWFNPSGRPLLKTNSCEHIAKEVADWMRPWLHDAYGLEFVAPNGRKWIVEVSEDGENGAVLASD